MKGPLIPVSELSSALRCPVRVFFNRSKPWVEPPEYTICKQISYHLGGRIDNDEVWEEIQVISPDIGPAYREFCNSCIEKCNCQEWRTSSGYDLFVKSDRFGICGTIDRIYNEEPYFSVVRSVSPPLSGVYPGDRIRVVGYALCLSEMLNKEVHGAFVEYIPGGTSRYCEIQPRDMRRFYTIKKALVNLNNGTVPKKPPNALCEACSYLGRCDPGPTRLSDLF